MAFSPQPFARQSGSGRIVREMVPGNLGPGDFKFKYQREARKLNVENMVKNKREIERDRKGKENLERAPASPNDYLMSR